jgi:hypothetical protein
MADHSGPGQDNISITEPKSAPPGRGTPANTKSDGQAVGEGAGGILGAASGAAIGAAAGPVGLVVGAIAGAVGGWWAGKGIAAAINSDDDVSFRQHYESSPHRIADRSYDEVRPSYVAGHLAAFNPDYRGRSFEEIEEDLRRGWSGEVAARHGSWPTVRGFARSAFDRARDKGSAV